MVLLTLLKKKDKLNLKTKINLFSILKNLYFLSFLNKNTIHLGVNQKISLLQSKYKKMFLKRFSNKF